MQNYSYILEAINTSKNLLDQFFNNQTITSLEKLVSLMSETLKRGNKIFSCGNGGSHCDSMHFTEELTGRFRSDRPPLGAICISNPAHITCVSNDYGFEYIFSRTVEALGKEGDLLFALSTSGNSKNLINATTVAHQKGLKVVALLGKSGGTLFDLADYSLVVPNQKSERIQEVHIKIIHILVEGIERNLFPELYS